MSLSLDNPPDLNLPDLIVHCDWGTNEAKRWMACATLGADGRYITSLPEAVDELASLLDRLRKRASGRRSILLGFDFPIGLPEAYVRNLEEKSFLQLLPMLGHGDWSHFYKPADEIADLSMRRPFYPDTPGKEKGDKTQAPFLKKLGVAAANDLRRQCERRQEGRSTACPLFWTVGGNQVGKSAIIGWRDVIGPKLNDPSVKLWPFHGPLSALLRPETLVIAETYPTQYHQRLFGRRFQGKRLLSKRKEVGTIWIKRADDWQIHLQPELKNEIDNGFPSSRTHTATRSDGKERSDNEDDRFDAAVGLFGMIDAVRNYQSGSEPAPGILRDTEGWILGQAAPKGVILDAFLRSPLVGSNLSIVRSRESGRTIDL